MGIVFRHEEGSIDIGVSPPSEVDESEWIESVDPNLSDGLPGLAINCRLTDAEIAEVGLERVDAGGPASGGVPMVKLSGDIRQLQSKLVDAGLPYRFKFGLEADI